MGIKSLVGLETIDSILAAFDTQRQALRNIASKLDDKSAAKKSQANALFAEAKAHADESLRALRVAERIDKLVE